VHGEGVAAFLAMTTLSATRHRRALNTGFRQRLQLALLTRSGKKRSALEKGFTLVELMIVIVIVGILAAVALPNFLGARDKAAAGAKIGTLQGFAKQCASEQLTGGGSLTVADVAAAGGTLSAVCVGDATPVTIKNTPAFPANNANINGTRCGADVRDAVAQVVCTFTITADGVITGAWGAS
jgi:type IV pilus assembly protein PilA